MTSKHQPTCLRTPTHNPTSVNGSPGAVPGLFRETENEKPVVDAQQIPSPPGWGKDSLSEFLELAQRNRYATFANKSEWYQKLSKLDDCFLRVGKGWINPPDLVTPLLYQRAHSAFRAAAGLAMSGQVTDLYPQIRACLEYAAYGLHIGENPASVDIWLARHSGAAGMKAVKTEFTVANVRESISKRDRHSAEVFDILYQRAIDFGGHPNERSVSGSMAMNEMEDRMEFLQMHLHGDGMAFLHGLKTTAQTGVCALEIFQCLYGARYELLGVRADLLSLRRNL